MAAYKKCGNVTSGKHNSGRKRKLTDRDKRVLTRIVARKRKQSLSQITSEVNSHLRNPISARTVQRELHASNLYGRVGIRKPLVTSRHALQRRQWCRTHRQWTPQQWQQVIWSDESTSTLFQTTGRVYVWRTPKEAFAPECIVPTVKHGGGSLMVWGAISWRGLGPLVTLHGKVKAAHYVNILGDQVHPFVQTSFPGECPLYQDDNAPIHTAKIVQEGFAEHEGEVAHLDWPPQSPDLNIIEPLWGYLESKLRARFPPPSTISALETALHEEWLHIKLQVVHDLYASIPRRIQSEPALVNRLVVPLFGVPEETLLWVSAADKRRWVYPLDPHPDAVVLYFGCTSGKRRAWYLPDDRHTASLDGLRGGWRRHSRMKAISLFMDPEIFARVKALFYPTSI
ncbi:transposable element Tc1 transposase [Trichonephila clavipes]|nr:transposable element Tc1 transposase [Trichonephila clavipes]